MKKYGYIKITNVSLDDDTFGMVCDTLKRLLTNHCGQNDKHFYLLGIDDKKECYNPERGCVTKLSVCFLDSVEFYLKRDFPKEVREGLVCEYIVVDHVSMLNGKS